jgi:hypothetical protein
MLRQRLRRLGWKVINSGPAVDGSWWLIARSCEHHIVALVRLMIRI